VTSDDSMDEFLADFGAGPASEEELDGVLERAHARNDPVLRLAVEELKTLRWLGRILLERVEKQPCRRMRAGPLSAANQLILTWSCC
jgi:hypothetical protein